MQIALHNLPVSSNTIQYNYMQSLRQTKELHTIWNLLLWHRGLCKDPCQGICGSGAECKVVNHFPVCRCLRGFNGDPFFQCKASFCNDNDQCPPDLACKGNNCKDPCEGVRCGANAKCWVVRHHATCICVPGYTGNPFEACAAVVEGMNLHFYHFIFKFHSKCLYSRWNCGQM